MEKGLGRLSRHCFGGPVLKFSMAKKKSNQAPGLFDKPKTAQELKLEGVQNLYNFLFEACNIIRGPVSQDNFKDYITPILYYKRISDVYDEETLDALQESGGDEEYASLPEQHGKLDFGNEPFQRYEGYQE